MDSDSPRMVCTDQGHLVLHIRRSGSDPDLQGLEEEAVASPSEATASSANPSFPGIGCITISALVGLLTVLLLLTFLLPAQNPLAAPDHTTSNTTSSP